MLKPGNVIHDRYQLKEQVGKNPGRQTWKAVDLLFTEPEQLVILKLLAFDLQIHWDNFKLFEREAVILYQLDHLHIPKYRDYFSIEDRLLWFGLVQECISGPSLQQLIDKGYRFSEFEVRNIASSLLKILIYLHELSPSVLHRDIKPSNIVLGEDKNIYLVDFGSVQARAAIEGATFTIVGTYGYTPIEQFSGRAVAASDLYALGATLIHLLTGVAPADLPQQDMRIKFQQYVSVSSDLIDWIDILIHPNVDLRFPTARQALTVLEAPVPVKPTISPPQIPASSRIHFSKTSHQLKIRIPQRGFKANDSLILLFALALYSAAIPFGIIMFPFGIIFGLIGLVPLSFLLMPAFGHVILVLEKNQFCLEWRLPGLRYRFVKGRTDMIREVRRRSNDRVGHGNKPLGSIEILVGQRLYQLGEVVAPMSETECQWLVQELKGWLGLT